MSAFEPLRLSEIETIARTPFLLSGSTDSGDFVCRMHQCRTPGHNGFSRHGMAGGGSSFNHLFAERSAEPRENGVTAGRDRQRCSSAELVWTCPSKNAECRLGSVSASIVAKANTRLGSTPRNTFKIDRLDSPGRSLGPVSRQVLVARVFILPKKTSAELVRWSARSNPIHSGIMPECLPGSGPVVEHPATCGRPAPNAYVQVRNGVSRQRRKNREYGRCEVRTQHAGQESGMGGSKSLNPVGRRYAHAIRLGARR